LGFLLFHDFSTKVEPLVHPPYIFRDAVCLQNRPAIARDFLDIFFLLFSPRYSGFFGCAIRVIFSPPLTPKGTIRVFWFFVPPFFRHFFISEGFSNGRLVGHSKPTESDFFFFIPHFHPNLKGGFFTYSSPSYFPMWSSAQKRSTRLFFQHSSFTTPPPRGVLIPQMPLSVLSSAERTPLFSFWELRFGSLKVLWSPMPPFLSWAGCLLKLPRPVFPQEDFWEAGGPSPGIPDPQYSCLHIFSSAGLYFPLFSRPICEPLFSLLPCAEPCFGRLLDDGRVLPLEGLKSFFGDRPQTSTFCCAPRGMRLVLDRVPGGPPPPVFFVPPKTCASKHHGPLV